MFVLNPKDFPKTLKQATLLEFRLLQLLHSVGVCAKDKFKRLCSALGTIHEYHKRWKCKLHLLRNCKQPREIKKATWEVWHLYMSHLILSRISVTSICQPSYLQQSFPIICVEILQNFAISALISFFFFFCIGPFYSPGEKFVTSECTHQLLRQSEL